MPTNSVQPAEAQRLTRHYVCSDCWGHLVEFFDRTNHQYQVRCTTEGCACSGYVTKAFVEQRKSEQITERAEAQAALRGVLDWLPPAQSAEQNLKDLGYQEAHKR